MSIRLSCTDVVSTIDDVTLAALPATVGRGEEADVCIHDSWASRIHCRFVEHDGELWVEDEQSSNGTRVNGEAVTAVRVRNGDELTVGITTLRVSFTRVPAGGKTPTQELVGT
jgi:pSer/pThr/pTyr-binding forkhead associated (FHA) protein